MTKTDLTVGTELENGSVFYTEKGSNLNDRIKNGETKLFLTNIEARDYAKENKSYACQVFISRRENGRLQEKPVHFGYAVPK